VLRDPLPAALSRSPLFELLQDRREVLLVAQRSIPGIVELFHRPPSIQDLQMVDPTPASVEVSRTLTERAPFSKRGKTPVVAGTGKRFGCNMISAITNRGRLYFMVFKSRFVSSVFVEFMRRLCKQIPRQVYLIVDSHPVHRSAAVRKEVEGYAGKLQLFFLPGYSPELNPDEYPNHDVKSNAVGRERPSTQHEMISNVRGYLRSTQRMPEIVRDYFRAKPVRYAAM
jgi:transposase